MLYRHHPSGSPAFRTPSARLATFALALLAVPAIIGGLALSVATAQPVAAANRTVVKIVGSTQVTLVLFSDGTVGGWGDVRDGALGPRAAIPAVSGHSLNFVSSIQLPRKAIDIAASYNTSYAVLDDGTVAAWGTGANGELGCGEPCRKGSETPIVIPGLTDVVQLSTSIATAFALHRDGTVSAWGPHEAGLFADGVQPKYLEASERSYTPLRLAGVSGITSLSAGMGYVLAITRSGHVMAWGKLRLDGSYADQNAVAADEVPGLENVVQVLCTGVAAVLKRDGTVWVWGNNANGQFGNGHRDAHEYTNVPVRVPGVADVVSLAGGTNGRHFLALRRDGSIVAWGNTDWGQIGAGHFSGFQFSPVTLSLRNVKSVFAVGANSFALDAAGQLWFWGGGSSFGAWPTRPNINIPTRLNIPDGLVPGRPVAPAPASPKPNTLKPPARP